MELFGKKIKTTDYFCKKISILELFLADFDLLCTHWNVLPRYRMQIELAEEVFWVDLRKLYLLFPASKSLREIKWGNTEKN